MTMENQQLEPRLYVVGTPIGNLEDITLRALRVLRSCSLVAAEDTRRTRKLLNHFDIDVKTISYRDENHARAAEEIIDHIASSQAAALVSDAGMPCISDPGIPLLQQCLEQNIPVEIVPGVSAVTTAATRSAMTQAGFTFAGFAPARTKARRAFYEAHGNAPLPLIIFETPHRLLDSLQDLRSALGQRHLVLGREISKIHEEWLTGSTDEIIADVEQRPGLRGEFTLVIGPDQSGREQTYSDAELRTLYDKMLDSGIHPKDALKALALQTGKPRKYLYDLLRKD